VLCLKAAKIFKGSDQVSKKSVQSVQVVAIAERGSGI
jgi:hypothetical protein